MTQVAEEIEPKGQVKSKKRVADHGEVFTAQRDVNAMLDFVKHKPRRGDKIIETIKITNKTNPEGVI